ncbi:MAG: SDR family NAD(P)-dependent oxidoreductase [Acidimicrobiales bacterium]
MAASPLAPSRSVELAGATVVVTGGASGIGFGLAQAFRDAGSLVVIADVDEAALEGAADTLGVAGVATDVTDPASVARLAEHVMAEHGAVHVVCNNAGVGPLGSIAEMTLDDWSFVLSVNLQGVVNGVHAFLPLLERNRDWGHVVNTSSIAALISPPRAGAYVASKAAVLGLTEVLAAELRAAGSKVGATALLPGTVRTNIRHSLRNRGHVEGSGLHEVDLEKERPEARFIEPAEVGRLVLDAVCRDEPYVVTHPELLPLIAEHQARILASAARTTTPRR